MKTRILFVMTIVALLLMPFGARADAAADGTITFQEHTEKLDHVLIVRHGNEEGMDSGPELRIFLSDQEMPLTAGAGATTFGAAAYARRMKINVVVISADPTGKSTGATVFLLNAPGLERGMFASSTVSNAFSAFRVGADRASGVAKFDEENLKVSATFDAPVAANPITADFKGPAARTSAPTKSLMACMAALRAGDPAGIAKVYSTISVQQINEERAAMGEATFRAQMKGMPDAATMTKGVARVIVRGANAAVITADKSVSELVMEDGAWKCNG